MNYDPSPDNEIFPCHRYNAYALGKDTDTTTFWSWDTNDAQNHYITRCGKWRLETIDGSQVKKLNPDFDCPAPQASLKARQVLGILSVQIVLYAQPTPFIILYHVVQYHQGLVNVLKDTTGTVMNVNHVR